MSDQELVAVMLGTGCVGRSVQELAMDALELLDRNISGLPPGSVKGLGKAKWAILLAAQELFRRRYAPKHWKVTGPKDVYPHLTHYADRVQEHFLVVTLNGAQEIHAIRTVSVGLVSRTLVHPREVFRRVIEDNAASAILAHNHPSGNLEPSREDREVTRRLVEAGQTLGIPILDHLVFSWEGYYSFQESGDM